MIIFQIIKIPISFPYDETKVNHKYFYNNTYRWYFKPKNSIVFTLRICNHVGTINV